MPGGQWQVQTILSTFIKLSSPPQTDPSTLFLSLSQVLALTLPLALRSDHSPTFAELVGDTERVGYVLPPTRDT